VRRTHDQGCLHYREGSRLELLSDLGRLVDRGAGCAVAGASVQPLEPKLCSESVCPHSWAILFRNCGGKTRIYSASCFYGQKTPAPRSHQLCFPSAPIPLVLLRSSICGTVSFL